jgi:hypothetical protein
MASKNKFIAVIGYLTLEYLAITCAYSAIKFRSHWAPNRDITTPKRIQSYSNSEAFPWR